MSLLLAETCKLLLAATSSPGLKNHLPLGIMALHAWEHLQQAVIW